MILANVAVAQELRRATRPTLYRVHGTPDDEKLERLRETLRVARHRGAACPRPVHDTRPAGDRAPRGRRSGARLRRVTGGALHAAGALPAEQHRPLRPGADALRALHLPDPALPGPGGASHAARRCSVPRAAAGDALRDAAADCAGREHLETGEARRRGRPLRLHLPQMRLPARAHRPDLPRPDHHRGGVRLLRADHGRGRRWPAAPGQPARR